MPHADMAERIDHALIRQNVNWRQQDLRSDPLMVQQTPQLYHNLDGNRLRLGLQATHDGLPPPSIKCMRPRNLTELEARREIKTS